MRRRLDLRSRSGRLCEHAISVHVRRAASVAGEHTRHGNGAAHGAGGECRSPVASAVAERDHGRPDHRIAAARGSSQWIAGRPALAELSKLPRRADVAVRSESMAAPLDHRGPSDRRGARGDRLAALGRGPRAPSRRLRCRHTRSPGGRARFGERDGRGVVRGGAQRRPPATCVGRTPGAGEPENALRRHQRSAEEAGARPRGARGDRRRPAARARARRRAALRAIPQPARGVHPLSCPRRLGSAGARAGAGIGAPGRIVRAGKRASG